MHQRLFILTDVQALMLTFNTISYLWVTSINFVTMIGEFF